MSNSLSWFRDAYRSRQAKEVLMNEVGGVKFSHTPCIGTDGLRSCTAVLLVTSEGAILGHVAPLPPGGGTYPEAGDDHTKYYMDRFIRYMDRYESIFPRHSSVSVIYAIFRNSVALPEQQTIITMRLRDAGMQVDTSQTYKVPYRPTHPNHGTVFVDSRGPVIKAYLEDTIIYTITKASSVTAPQYFTTISSATTAAAVLPGTYLASGGVVYPLSGYYLASDGRNYLQQSQSN